MSVKAAIYVIDKIPFWMKEMHRWMKWMDGWMNEMDG
jgi:hypothetical protein